MHFRRNFFTRSVFHTTKKRIQMAVFPQVNTNIGMTIPGGDVRVLPDSAESTSEICREVVRLS